MPAIGFFLMMTFLLFYEQKDDVENTGTKTIFKREYPPCLPEISLSDSELLADQLTIKIKIRRSFQEIENYLKHESQDPDLLWKALTSAVEIENYLSLLSEIPDTWQERKKKLMDLLLARQKRHIRELLLEINRARHLKQGRKLEYFRRRLLRFVPDRRHVLHQQLRFDLDDW
jgi:hypothetical protein